MQNAHISPVVVIVKYVNMLRIVFSVQHSPLCNDWALLKKTNCLAAVVLVATHSGSRLPSLNRDENYALQTPEDPVPDE